MLSRAILSLGLVCAFVAAQTPQCKDPVQQYLMTNTAFTYDASLSISSAFRTLCPTGSTISYSVSGTPAYWTVDVTTGSLKFAGMSKEGTAKASVLVMCVASPTSYSTLCATSFSLVVSAPLVTKAPTPAPPTPAPVTTATPPTTTLPPALSTPCNAVYGYDVVVSQQYTGTLLISGATTCPAGSTTSFTLLQGPSTTATLTFDGVGGFVYNAPSTPNFDRFRISLNCNSAPICSATAYLSVNPQSMTTTPAPPITTTGAPTVAPLQTCDNVYFFQAIQFTPPFTSTAQRQLSLMNIATRKPCDVNQMSFVLISPPQGTQNFTLFAFGPFLYAPMTTAWAWDNFTFIANCAADATSGGQPWSCAGTANIQTLPFLTAAPGQTLPPDTQAPQVFVPQAKLTCSGTCNEAAWITTPIFPDRWDNSPDSPYVRADGKPVDYTTITFSAGSIIITALGAIGNMAARFPTFEPLPPLNSILVPDSLKGIVNAGNLPFDEACLANQQRFGAGEEVWFWTNFTAMQGHVGEFYRSGKSYYQKYGGKHVGCDTFLDACNYAPLLNPKGPWYISINNCDTTWSATFNRTALLNLTTKVLDPVFVRDTRPQFNALHNSRPVIVVRATVYNEAVRPKSWVSPKLGFTSRDSTTDLDAVIEENIRVEFVGATSAVLSTTAPTTMSPPSVTKAPSGTTTKPPATTSAPSWSGVNALTVQLPSTAWVNGAIERFTYIGADGGLWVGYNVLMLPREAEVKRAPIITGIMLANVTWSPLTVSMCGKACAGMDPIKLRCVSNINKTITPNMLDCMTDDTLLPITPGPAGVVTCPSKPFSPPGIPGLSDTSCTGGQVARSANITLRIRLGDANSQNVLPYFPEGDITFSILQTMAVNGQAAVPSQESFTLRLSSNLVGVATVDTGNILHGSADVAVTLCRAVLWPANPLKDPTTDVPLTNETCIAVDERSIGVEDYAILSFVGTLADSTTAAPVVTNGPTTAAAARRQSVNGNSTADNSTTPPNATTPPLIAAAPKLTLLYAAAYAGTTTALALAAVPVLLVNDSLASMPYAARRIALLPAYGTFLNVRRNIPNVTGDVNLGFSPGPLCESPNAQCVILVEAAFLLSTGETVTVRKPVVVDPLLTNEARTGISRVMASFFSVMYRENGIPPALILPNASQFSVLVSVILCFVLLIMGAVHIYTTKNSREVFDEHQRVLKMYLINVGALIPGVNLVVGKSKPKPAPKAASPAASPAKAPASPQPKAKPPVVPVPKGLPKALQRPASPAPKKSAH